jgi:hypothetical protein
MKKQKLVMLMATGAAALGLVAVSAEGMSAHPLSLKAADVATKSVIFGAGGNHIDQSQAATILASGSLNEGSSIVYSRELTYGTTTFGTNSSDPLVTLNSVQKGGKEYSHVIEWKIIISLKNITRVDISLASSVTSGAVAYCYTELVAYTGIDGSGTKTETDDDSGDYVHDYLTLDQTSYTYTPSAKAISQEHVTNSVVFTVNLKVSNDSTGQNTKTGTVVLNSITLTWSC